jgi:aerobic carbon-monoxide dehydrogenase medium subunit
LVNKHNYQYSPSLKTTVMKSPSFSYLKAASLDHLFASMAEYGNDLRILAGGQTLLATLNMRLSQPSLVIDIRGLDALKGITLGPTHLRIGALVTHTQIEASAVVAQHVPLMAQAVPHIAHRAIRNLGTLGGSIAYADPAGEWPVCAVALGAQIVLLSSQGERRVNADDFFQGLYTTAARADEIVMACEFPLVRAQEKHDFSELARRHGDYAIVGLAACQRPGQTRLAFLGIADRPVRAHRAEEIVNAEPQRLSDKAVQAAVQSLATDLHPLADLTHSAASKLHLAGVLLQRALRRLSGQLS